MLQALLRRLLPGLHAPLPKLDAETFILWEPCSHSHGEIVPGYAKYLLDLGYRVLVLLTPARIDEGLFSRFSHPRLHVARLSQRQIRRFMRSADLSRAAGVMVTTAGKLPERADHSLDLPKVFGGRVPRPLLLVEHEARRRIEAGYWDPRNITLRRLMVPGVESVVVNPHYFGPVTPRPKNPKTVFLMAGAARSKRRNQDMVLDAVRRLLAEGETGFELRLIGKPGKTPLPDDLRSHVVDTGRVSFDRLYHEVEACDFVLTAFQRDNPDHAFYRTTGTTGSFQLAYGFRKPCIIQQEFAVGTALTAENSLFYDDDADLYHCLRRAIAMPGDSHAQMCSAMQRESEALAQRSLAGLKGLIDG